MEIYTEKEGKRKPYLWYEEVISDILKVLKCKSITEEEAKEIDNILAKFREYEIESRESGDDKNG